MSTLAENSLGPNQDAYIDWLCTAPAARVPSSKDGYALELGVATSTLYRWEAKDVFRREWARRSEHVIGSPERTKNVLDALYASAIGGDVKAALGYLEQTRKMQPTKLTEATTILEELSDEELDELLDPRLAKAMGR